MMTEEQRYLFDLNGYLHLKNAMTEEEVASASEAADGMLRRMKRICRRDLANIAKTEDGTSTGSRLIRRWNAWRCIRRHGRLLRKCPTVDLGWEAGKCG